MKLIIRNHKEKKSSKKITSLFFMFRVKALIGFCTHVLEIRLYHGLVFSMDILSPSKTVSWTLSSFSVRIP